MEESKSQSQPEITLDLNQTKPAVESAQETWQQENQNRALQTNCAIHFQPLLKIVDPEYQRQCLKCIRQIFLKRDQEQLRS